MRSGVSDAIPSDSPLRPRHLLVIRDFMDRVADVDGPRLDDVGPDTASMDEATKCSRRREPFEMGAGFATALSEAADLTDAEVFADESVEVDAAGDDVAPSLFRRDRYSASLEFGEGFGFDQGDVLADSPRAGREGPGLVLVAVAIDSARTRGDRHACDRVRGGMRRGHQRHGLPVVRQTTVGDG